MHSIGLVTKQKLIRCVGSSPITCLLKLFDHRPGFASVRSITSAANTTAMTADLIVSDLFCLEFSKNQKAHLFQLIHIL